MIYVGAIFIILGAVVHFAKFYDLMAGVNTMSKEEKEKMDLPALGKFFWQIMLVMGLLLMASDIAGNLLQNPNIPGYGMWVIILPGTIYMIVIANSERFTKK